jgi:hypothetical protein
MPGRREPIKNKADKLISSIKEKDLKAFKKKDMK